MLATWGGINARTSVREHIREGGVEKGAPSEEAPRWREPASRARKEVCTELVESEAKRVASEEEEMHVWRGGRWKCGICMVRSRLDSRGVGDREVNCGG